jgi:predicted RNase H-like nuclease
MRFVGVDLAWAEGSERRPANETGLCVIDASGRILGAGWARGIDAVTAWILDACDTAGAAVAIDAPLVVPNASGMRESEKQVGRAYGRWKVSANASSQSLGWLGGVTLRNRLEAAGFVVASGTQEPALETRSMFECYPYTTLVGVEELGYDSEGPRYKRLDRALAPSDARAARAAATDELVRRLSALDSADPPLLLSSHPLTRELAETPSPLAGPAHKHREDLIDAALCAWTASFWWRHGASRVQILGEVPVPGEPQDPDGRPATIVAPARASQRLPGPLSR